MFKLRKNIFAFFLILSLLASGLPVFHPQDANRDQRISLEDAILLVRGLADSAENPELFTSSVRSAIRALRTAAGLKTVIQPDDDAVAGSTVFALDLPWLTGIEIGVTPDRETYNIPEETFYYHSLSIAPSPPPPQMA